MQTIKNNYVSVRIGKMLVKFHYGRKLELMFNQYLTDLTNNITF